MVATGDLRSCDLTDGRQMSYREYGDPTGVPVINCHGGLMFGSDIAPAHDAASALGVRLISPDRPGIGLSSPFPGRTTGDWANDVHQLTTHLGLQAFSVFGWSLGGQYALGLAAQLPEVQRVVVVAGTPELDAELLPELNDVDRNLIGLAKNQPLLMRTLTIAAGNAALHLPSLVLKVTRASLSEPDHEALDQWPPEDFAACMAHALRQPEGIVEEYLVESRPWGFELNDADVPVALWQGADDHLVPPHWMNILAGALPSAQVHLVPDAGHFVAYDRWAEVLADLLPAETTHFHQ